MERHYTPESEGREKRRHAKQAGDRQPLSGLPVVAAFENPELDQAKTRLAAL